MPQSAASLTPTHSVPPTAPRLAQSIERAYVLAQRQGHGLVTAEHLLFALTEDADVLRLFDASRVDVERVQSEVLSHLTRVHEELAALAAARPEGPRPGPDMLTALTLAAQVAQSSRRAAIDGALVVTVLVADGRSVAAGILRGLGLSGDVPPSGHGPGAGAGLATGPSLGAPAALSSPANGGNGAQQGLSRLSDRLTVPPADALLQAARERLKATGLAQVGLAAPPLPTPPRAPVAASPPSSERASSVVAQMDPVPAVAPSSRSPSPAPPLAPPPRFVQQAEAVAAPRPSMPPPLPPPAPTSDAPYWPADPWAGSAAPQFPSASEPSGAPQAMTAVAAPAQSEYGAYHPDTQLPASLQPDPRSDGFHPAGGPWDGMSQAPSMEPPFNAGPYSQPANPPASGWPAPGQAGLQAVGTDFEAGAPFDVHGLWASQAQAYAPPHDLAPADRGGFPAAASPRPASFEPSAPVVSRPAPAATAPAGISSLPAPSPDPSYSPAGAPYPSSVEPGRPYAEDDYSPIALPIQPSAALDLKELVRRLPRKLQRGKPDIFELAIPRDALQQLVPGAFDDAYPLRPEIFASRAIAARLIAPADGIAVEPLSAETVWIGPEGVTGRRVSDDDILTWRWQLVGRSRGQHKVQVAVSARLIGPDGLAADTPFPVQTVDVVVVQNTARLARRIGLGLGLLAIGTLVGLIASGRFGRLLSLLS